MNYFLILRDTTQKQYCTKTTSRLCSYKGSKVVCLLDAKYRDLWETKLPSGWLYQLSIYAVSGIGNNNSKILYPSMSKAAKLQKIDIKNPVNGNKYAEVMIQPVSLHQVAEFIDLPSREKYKAEEYIKNIVFGS